MKAPDGDLARVGRELLEDAEIDASRLDDLVGTVRAVRASDIWSRASASSLRLTEVPFEVLFDGDDGIPRLVRGSIDLAFKEDGGWVIVDYKTDTPPASGDLCELAEKYRPQLDIYTGAFEKCTGERVVETALYFIRADKLITTK
jgi:ATP-dependent helicase/nuclease subunit A